MAVDYNHFITLLLRQTKVTKDFKERRRLVSEALSGNNTKTKTLSLWPKHKAEQN